MFERFLSHPNEQNKAKESTVETAVEEPIAQKTDEDVNTVVPEFPDDDETPEEALPVDEADSPAIEPPVPPSFLQKEKIEDTEGMSSVAQPPRPPMAPVAPTVSHPKAAEVSEEKVESNEPPAKISMADFAAQVAEQDKMVGKSLHDLDFADIWFSPEGIAYVRDKKTRFALTPIETEDLKEFHEALEQGFQGTSSYAIKFAGDSYRVERVSTIDGLQYNCRKMPAVTPEIETLGFAPAIVKHLTSLGRASGLLLFAGPTGQGKTTTVSALMKRFLDTDGGFLYTIEDPPEMPLSGVYHAKNGGLGLCKQTAVENDQWGAGLRSALRSKPRYILVGEIRTPETASQCLVAATSGHLVLSTIHANGVEDALNSMIKYAASTGLDNGLVADLLARGILGVIHQRLEGTQDLKLIYQCAFANPNAQAADQMRMAIRDTNLNLATFMEQQKTRMEKGLPMFRE